MSVDVTALIGGGGIRTLALVGLAGKPLELASRESKGKRPQLVIQPGPAELSLPIRAAFYYPWFPNAWKQRGLSPYTKYTPSAGSYDSGDPGTIRSHIEAMRYGKIQAGIASWWGRGHHTDSRLPKLFEVANALGGSFRWGIYYEAESRGDPSEADLRADLTYLRDRYGGEKSALRVGGRFVVFVYAGAGDGCQMAERWSRANTVGAFVVLKVFSGFRGCPSQPDAWHQYAPALDSTAHLPWAVSISPGFHLAEDAQPRLGRDLSRWQRNIRELIASKARFQLVTSVQRVGGGNGRREREGVGERVGLRHVPRRTAYGRSRRVGTAATRTPAASRTPAACFTRHRRSGRRRGRRHRLRPRQRELQRRRRDGEELP